MVDDASSPRFLALVIREPKQKTPLTLEPYREPSLGAGELLVENVAVAQVTSAFTSR